MQTRKQKLTIWILQWWLIGYRCSYTFGLWRRCGYRIRILQVEDVLEFKMSVDVNHNSRRPSSNQNYQFFVFKTKNLHLFFGGCLPAAYKITNSTTPSSCPAAHGVNWRCCRHHELQLVEMQRYWATVQILLIVISL